MAKQRSMYGKDDLYVTDRSSPNATRVTDVQKWRTNQDDIRHLPGALPIQRLAIQDGAIGPSAAFIVVDTEGGSPADNLTTINPGELHDGMEIELSSADSSRIVTIKNSTNFSGIRTLRGEDVVLGMSYSIRFKLISTESITYWQELPAAVKISDSVSLEDSDTAASAKAVKTVVDILKNAVPEIAARASMPSERFIEIVLNSGTTYTAPADGFVQIVQSASKINEVLFLRNETTSFESRVSAGADYALACSATVPCRSGDVVKNAGNFSGTLALPVRFYYAEGSA